MWNEEAYIERAISESKAVCERMVDDGTIGDYELIVVDDKSTDATPEIADALAAADPQVRVVHHEVNRKLGGSIKTGFATARGDIVLYSDADLPFDFEEVPRALRILRLYNCDLVSAYRFDRTGEGYTRAIYTFFYNLLIRTMFGVKARDINFAFKLVRRNVLDDDRAAQRGLVHRRRTDHQGDPLRIRAPAVRGRLLPAHDGRIDAELAGRHLHDHEGDVSLRGDLEQLKQRPTPIASGSHNA